MKTRYALLLIAILLAWLGSAAAGTAGDMSEELDGLKNIRLLDTHFARYGFKPYKTIQLQDKGIEFHFPDGVKDMMQTGLYSYVVLRGDFEVEASFEWEEFPDPRGEYPMSCGIAVDTNGEGGNLMIARFFDKNNRMGYNVVRGEWQGPGKPLKYDEKKSVVSKAKIGGLSLRREGDVLICLAADNQRQLQEIHRIEGFTTDPIRTFRVYADPAKSPTEMHVWMGQLRVRADEIFGGFSKSERPEDTAWWHYIVAGSLTVVIGGLLWRWRQRRQAMPSDTPARPRLKAARPSVK
jgi:hypothetical protein